MQTQKKVYGHFSARAGSRVRRMYSNMDGTYLGTIRKLDTGGYEVRRKDGKVRVKAALADAYKSIARAN